MSGFFDDIDKAWKGKRVEFISGEHKGEKGTCEGFFNTYGGAGIRIQCDNGDSVMVYPRLLGNIKIIDHEQK